MQGVDRVDHGPRQRDRQHGDADEQQLNRAAVVPGKDEGEAHTQEADDARHDQ
jgi:hypothetical protein